MSDELNRNEEQLNDELLRRVAELLVLIARSWVERANVENSKNKQENEVLNVSPCCDEATD